MDNALEAIRKSNQFLDERGIVADEILPHPDWTSRGYVFIVEKNSRYYILVNDKDLDLAFAWLRWGEERKEDIYDFTFGVPITRDEQKFQTVVGGRYICVLELESAFPAQQRRKSM